MSPLSTARHRAAREEGWALVTAIILTAVMMSLGLATYSVVGTQQTLSGVNRQKDTAFNIAEAALNQELFALSSQWPGPGSAAYPTCTQASVDTRCPNASILNNMFAGTPDGAGATWQVNVYDNGVNAQGQSSQAFYAEGLTTTQPSTDANADNQVWVRAQATVAGRTRVLVGIAQTQKVALSIPHAALIAGAMQTGNNGKKVLIDTQGSGLSPGSVLVRCDPNADPNCLSYRAGAQISPDTASGNYTGGPSLSASALAQMKALAQANGTYYATCPGSVPSGAVVWIDSGNCSYTGNGVGNAGSPGVTFINNGTISLGGTIDYFGLIYAVNAQGSTSTTSPIVSTFGNAHIRGAIIVDGGGDVSIGSSAVNLTYDSSVFGAVTANGTAFLVPNTFRQIAK